jgi:hypothetical protein
MDKRVYPKIITLILFNLINELFMGILEALQLLIYTFAKTRNT